MFLFKLIPKLFGSFTTIFGVCMIFVAYTMYNSSEYQENKQNVASIQTKHEVIKGELLLDKLDEIRKPKTKEILFYSVPVVYVQKRDTNQFTEYFYKIPSQKNVDVLLASQEPYFVTANLSFYEKNIRAVQSNIALVFFIAFLMFLPTFRKLYIAIKNRENR